jgi:hypothetical protein
MDHIERIERNEKETGGEGDTPTREVPLPTSIIETPHQANALIVQANTQSQTDDIEEDADGKEMDSTSPKEILVDVTADCLSYEDDSTNLYTSERRNMAHISSV